MSTLPPFLYHGTSTGYIESILAVGLRPESSYKGYLCYADEVAIAWHHAEFMAEWDAETLAKKCKPIIFRMSIERFDIAAFCVDRNFIVLGPSAGRAVGTDLSRSKPGWRQLLRRAGAVGYRKTLAVSRADILQPVARAAA